MVVDSSAVVAIAAGEPERERFRALIEHDVTKAISAASVLESVIVMMRRMGSAEASSGRRIIYDLIEHLDIDVEPVTQRQVDIAGRAFQVYGKGFHPAGLNFGDCFAYALAKDLGEPLLFKGGDFAATDIASVL